MENKSITRQNALEIIARLAEAYQKADKRGRGEILDALESTLHRPRKSLIRTINRYAIQYGAPAAKLACVEQETKAYRKQVALLRIETRGRPRKYTKEVEAALVEIWESYNYICAERLYPQVSTAIAIFKRDHDWHYSEQATQLLEKMPLGTMKAYLVRFARDKGLMRGFSTTRSSEVLNAVPIFHGDWTQKPVGYGQIDTVVHSGPRLEGAVAYTVNFIDMQTYWQEFRAQLGKTAETTKTTVSKLIQRLPFLVTGIHSDTGDEFVNSVLVAWCKRKHIEFTRSRPHEKNDNCNIEERNGYIIRRYIGYERYDCQATVEVLNELYGVLRLYVNYFQPIMKITSKVRLPNGGCIRKYDQAKTPYERVLAHSDIKEVVKQRLAEEYQALNPKQLLAKIKTLTLKLERTQRELGYHFNIEA